MESINSFPQGINNDLGKTVPQKNTYVEAYNFRILTESGQSTGVLSNVKGNEFILQFPDTCPYYKLNLTTNSVVNTLTFDIVITDGGVFNGTYNVNFTTSNPSQPQSTWLNEIVEYLNNFSGNLQAVGFKAFTDGDSIFLTCYTSVKYKSTVANFAQLSIANLNPLEFSQEILVSKQAGLIPIGSTNIRDEIYIITTSKFNVTTTGAGQIWKLTYDATNIDQTPLPNTTNLFTLELLYNNNLDLSLSFPVAPTAIVGNYENDLIKKLYWCDFNNPIKVFNTGDPDAFWLDPTLLENKPSVNFSFPILQKIDTGILTPGMYQYVYRLKNTSGSATNWSLPSYASHIVISPETDSITTYKGTSNTTTNTGKGNRIKITGLDTDFERVEIAYIKRLTVRGLPVEVAIFADEPVNTSTGEIEIVHTGGETAIDISISEIQSYNYAPDVAKTLTTKDNILLLGNVKVQKLDLNFDARAFRYPKNSTTTYAVGANPDELDDINPNQEPTSYNNYLYQRNSSILGGSGPNISYKFVIEETTADTEPLSGLPYKNAFTENRTIDYNTGVTYPSNNTRFDTPSPMASQVIRGLQRDEVYRFGIVFFDKSGNPGWVKWVADIRMPHIYMPDTTSSDPQDRTMQYQLMYENSNSDYIYNNLGIEFTVDTSSINSEISGYSIVRVKRENKDKTVLAQGLLHPAHNEDSIAYLTNYTYRNTPPGTPTPNFYAPLDYDDYIAHLISPETLFVDGIYVQPITRSAGSDYVEVISVVNDIMNGGGSGVENATPSERQKFYTFVSKTLNSTYRTPNSPGSGTIAKKFDVGSTTYVDNWNNVPQAYSINVPGVGNIVVKNRSIDDAYNKNKGGNNNPCPDDELLSGGVCSGEKTFVLALRDSTLVNGTATWSDIFNLLPDRYAWVDGLFSTVPTGITCSINPLYGTRAKYLANYKRIVQNQYGGNTLSQRADNSYIYCGHFQPVTDTVTLYTSKVFGGDTWIKVMDLAYQKKGYFYDNFNTADVGSHKRVVGFMFPCETSLNLELREGEHLNITTFPDNGSGIDTQEDFILNTVYSVETDYITFFPKPVPFVETEKFDTRVYASGVKINGELEDSWGIFSAVDYKDVDSVHGSINSMLTFNNQVYFFQDRAFGILPIFPRAVLNNGGTPDTQLQLGIGQKIDKHQYMSTDTGTKHQWSTLATGDSIYWYDVLSKKMYRYRGGSQKISDVKGLHAYFDKSLIGLFLTNDNPVLEKGVCGVYDYKNNEVIYTFHDQDVPTQEEQEAAGDSLLPVKNKFTVSFNEITDTFVSFYNFYPFIYINNRQIFLSPDHASLEFANKLYVHGKGDYCKFYNFTYPSLIKILSNDNPTYTKIFNNLVWHTESINRTNNQFINMNDDTFDYIRVFNDYQNTDYQPLVLNDNLKRKERNWNIQVPRNRVLYSANNSPNIFTDINIGEKDYGERLRDKYISIDLRYDNRNNYNFLFHYLKTIYLISDR